MAPDPAEIDDRSSMHKIEEATGGAHQGAPRAGFEDDGNLEGIQDGRPAERD